MQKFAPTHYFGITVLLLGCSDYKVNQITQPQTGDSSISGEPIIDVTPTEFFHGGTCENQEQIISISNFGEAPLEILTATVQGGNWQVTTPPLPLTLETNEKSDWLVSGQGIGTLNITSNDPLTNLIEVPLETDIDQPPEILITAPYDGFIIPVTGTVLSARVNDDIDQLSNIPIRWTSNVDGVLAETFASPTGESNLVWPSSRTPGPHRVTVRTMDSCDGRSMAAIDVCQQYGYDVENLDISSWHFEGAANWDTTNNWLELTQNVTNTVGTAFSTAIPVNGDNVEIEFSFYIGDGSGADGISLTAIDTSRMTTFLGGTGCGIGYGGDAACTNGPALPGWSIEVDTYYNGGQDPTSEDHVMFTFDGDVDDPAIWAVLPEMEDTGWHTMRVVVTAPRVRIEIDGVTYVDSEISGNFNFPAYVGFTAGTGGATNRHLIDSLTVTETVCQSDG